MFLVTNVRSLNENELSETKGKRQPFREAKNAANRLMAKTVMLEPEDDSNSDAEDVSSDPVKEENKAKNAPIKLGAQKYACPICSKITSESFNMKNHIMVHTGEKPFVCDTCGAAFTEKGNLAKHNLVHTGEKPFSCNLCNKSFARNWNLKQHQKRIHSKI